MISGIVGAKRGLLVALGLAIGIAIGLGAFTFTYAKGFSYLGNDASACANCHVMEDYYSAWMKSSHRQVAACNDCHAPHNLIGKMAVKAINGVHHSYAFTTGRYPQALRISDFNLKVTEGACKDCHAQITSAIRGHTGDDISCVRCHFTVGHEAAAFVPVVSTTAEPREGAATTEDTQKWHR